MMTGAEGKLSLDRPAAYEIQVPGYLGEGWADWDRRMTVTVNYEDDGTPVTTLTGTVDQSALHGVLRRLYALGLPLISIRCAECG